MEHLGTCYQVCCARCYRCMNWHKVRAEILGKAGLEVLAYQSQSFENEAFLNLLGFMTTCEIKNSYRKKGSICPKKCESPFTDSLIGKSMNLSKYCPCVSFSCHKKKKKIQILSHLAISSEYCIMSAI